MKAIFAVYALLKRIMPPWRATGRRVAWSPNTACGSHAKATGASVHIESLARKPAPDTGTLRTPMISPVDPRRSAVSHRSPIAHRSPFGRRSGANRRSTVARGSLAGRRSSVIQRSPIADRSPFGHRSRADRPSRFAGVSAPGRRARVGHRSTIAYRSRAGHRCPGYHRPRLTRGALADRGCRVAHRASLGQRAPVGHRAPGHHRPRVTHGPLAGRCSRAGHRSCTGLRSRTGSVAKSLASGLGAAARGLVWLAALAWLSCLVAAPVAAAKAAERPNVLFIFTDDQRRDTIHAWGNTYIATPNIDRIARAGVSFTNCYVQGSMVGAVCHPSRAMLMTGRSLFHIDTNVPLLPEVFRKAGYQTFASGKMHGAKGYFNRMFEDGDELFFGGMGSHTQLPVFDYDPTGKYPNSKRHRVESFTSEAFANAVIRFLENRDRNRPFFVYLATTAPHDPRTPPPTYRVMYKPEEMPLPPNFMSLHPFNNGWMTGRDERLARWPRTPEEIRRHLADYYGMITHLDAQVGRVLDTLERLGDLENTIIVFASDNGLAIGSHGLMGKQSVYEHSTGVPLIIAAPGMPANEKRDALVYLYDIYPTLCELAGISIPETVEGKSLVPVLASRASGVRDTLYTAFMPQRAVRDRRWKLIRYTHINKTQLFDLQNDPYELRDLSDDPEYAGKVQELMAVLRHWQRILDDAQPLTTENPEPVEFVPPTSKK